MNKITQKDFLQRLKNCDSLIMKELYSQWKNWIYKEFKTYEHNENLILIKGNDNYEVDMFIFNYDDCVELLNKYKDDCNCSKLCVSIKGELVEQLNKYYGFRCFERIGISEQINDKNIKLLTKENSNGVLELCDKLSKQGNFSKGEAESLKYYIENIDDYSKNSKAYGYFKEGILIGFVILNHYSTLHYSMLVEIGVLEEYRRLGIATKLSKFVLSKYPNEKYLYQAAHLNKASIDFSKSLGFEFVGVRELMIKG